MEWTELAGLRSYRVHALPPITDSPLPQCECRSDPTPDESCPAQSSPPLNSPSNTRRLGVILHQRDAFAVAQRALKLRGADDVEKQARDQPGAVLALEAFNLGAVLEWQYQVHDYSVLRCSAASMSVREGARQS